MDTPAGEVMVLRRSVEDIAHIEGLIFDMDGVLINVSESIQLVHRAAAERYFSALGWTNCSDMVTPDDVDAFKLAGGFNADWDTASVWVRLYALKSITLGCTDAEVLKSAQPLLQDFASVVASRGGGLEQAVAALKEMCDPSVWTKVEAIHDRQRIERVFMESYAGSLCREVYGFDAESGSDSGLIHYDRPFLDRKFIPEGVKLGIATGRTRGEAKTGLRLMGWSDLFSPDSVITEDDGFRKPDPEVLRLATSRMKVSNSLYLGDTPDDFRTVRRFRRAGASMFFAAVLTGLPQPGVKEKFIEKNADIIAEDVNSALAAVRQLMGGMVCPDGQPN